MRLFCFHHAGGGKMAFNAWKRSLSPAFEVVAVEIPNRDRFATLGELVEEVNEQLAPQLDGPHVFFGHSFGALVAYRLARLRAAEKSLLPRAMFLSSYAPPHLGPPLHMVQDLDNEQLGTLLCDLGGLPAEMTRWPVLRESVVAVARNDLRLCMTDDDTDVAPLPVPIHVLGGSDDPIVSEADLRQWRSRTSADFSVRMLRGGHFYLSDKARLFETLRPMLSKVAAAAVAPARSHRSTDMRTCIHATSPSSICKGRRTLALSGAH
jgi:surfactin synthase thioesterase subunit